MAQIKLDLENIPLPNKILFARQVIMALTSNATFPSPEPTLADIWPTGCPAQSHPE